MTDVDVSPKEEAVREISLPDLCLVVLVGVTGSGKSTFARTHFRPTQVLSSDAFRAMVADDENDQSASAAAFEALHHVASLRLAAGRLTVIDATNVQAHARAALVRLAREHDVLPVAIVLDVSIDECWRRTQSRTDRPFAQWGGHGEQPRRGSSADPRNEPTRRSGRDVVARQHRDLRRSIGNLAKEGFRGVHVLRGPEQIAAARVSYQRLFNDRKDLTGPFDIIGDVHGCRAELEALLADLGYTIDRDEAGQAVDATHPAGRLAVFVGDLVDRGPDVPGVLRLAMGMVDAGHALCVAGNHEDKLLRALRGRNVKVTHGLAESLAQLDEREPLFRERVVAFLDGLISHYVLDEGRLVVAHAGLKEAYQGRASGRVRSFCLYGETTGETDEYGLPVRYPWANEYRGRATVVYGHTPTPKPEWVNNTLCIDTGAVFGGSLTALRYPERELVSVPAARVYYDPVRPFPTAEPGDTGHAVDPEDHHGEDAGPASGLLSLADVTGRRWIDTGYGRVTIPAENAAAALEVMGRFAIDPADLWWLPPTMAPCSTALANGSTLNAVAAACEPSIDHFLEHPLFAFDDYRRAEVDRVVCEVKHMGSRVVALVRRDGTGALYTRTGRAFFSDPTITAMALRSLTTAVAAAGLFDELASDWLLLDGELLPWSAKALELIKDQYASVAAAARASLPVAVEVLTAAAGRGLPVDGLRDRTVRRLDRAEAFAEAYRRYCWPTEGRSGVRIAPFALLASAGRQHAGQDRDWHLTRCDRLAEADPTGFVTRTDRRVVDLSDLTQVAEAVRWWIAHTRAGGEGMVVKPYGGVRGSRLVQPGIKMRGREYLRIIYGPDYTAPEQLAQLRDRHLGRKRALALREHALGLAALDRVAGGEPLWRVHEAVFAILACESEPVDPRL
jgi:polynucleotide kinase-phosphatase